MDTYMSKNIPPPPQKNHFFSPTKYYEESHAKGLSKRFHLNNTPTEFRLQTQKLELHTK